MIKNIVNRKIEGLKSIQQATCLLGSIRCILEYWNRDIDIRESTVLGFGFGYSFRYGHYISSDERYKINFNMPDIACFHMYLDRANLSKFCNNMGVELIEQENSSFDELTESIKSEISSGRPIMVPVNNEYLTYLSEDLKYAMGRFVISNGWDDINDKAYVIDQFIPSAPPSTYSGSLPASEFIKALDLYPVAQDNDYRCWHFKPTGNSSPLDYEAYLKSSINDNFASKVEEYCFKDSKVIYYSGLQGIEMFRSDLTKIREMGISDDIVKWLVEVHSLLISFGGPVKARMLYIDFLDWLNGKHKIDPELSVKAKELHNLWTVISNVIFKAGKNRDIKSLNRVIEKIDKLMELEQNFINLI